MEALGNIFSVLCFGWISLQDFRTRSVFAFLLPLAGVFLLLAGCGSMTSGQIVIYSISNSALLLLLFCSAWLVVCMRRRKFVRFMDEQVGWGDVVFLFCLTPVFSPLNFILFFVAGTFFAILAGLIVGRIQKRKMTRIPFAGLLSLPIIIICIMNLAGFPLPRLCDDAWLIERLLA